jgi:surface protein
MRGLFENATNFNGDVSKWDVSRVLTMERMVAGASSFNADLSRWDVSQVSNMQSMFEGASSFSGDLSSWNVSQVSNMHSMFKRASNFIGELVSCSPTSRVGTEVPVRRYLVNGDFSADDIPNSPGHVFRNPYGWGESVGDIAIVRNGNEHWGAVDSGVGANFISIHDSGAALTQTLNHLEGGRSYVVAFMLTHLPGYSDDEPLRVNIDGGTVGQSHAAVGGWLFAAAFLNSKLLTRINMPCLFLGCLHD